MSIASEMISDILIDSSAKSIVIFTMVVVALIVIRLIRARPNQVHAVHRIWVFMIASMLLLPLLGFALPGLSISVPFLKNDSTEAISTQSDLSGEIHNESIAGLNFDPANTDEVADAPGLANYQTDLESITMDASPPTAVPMNADLVGSSFNSSKFASTEPKPAIHGWTTILSTLWALVCMAFLVKIAIGKLCTRRLIKRATSVESTELKQNVTGAKIVESGEISSPAVSGLFSHTIILPSHWRQWDQQKRSAVIAHELAHIHRRDGIVVFLAQVNTALFWFNPIAWIAKSKVNRLAELACDQQAALETGDRLGYAQQLIEIAAAKMEHPFQPGIAMAAPRGISERIEMLLDPTLPFTKKASRVFIVTLLLIGIPTLMVVAAAQPNDDDQKTEAQRAAENWIRTEDGKTILTFRGKVVLENGGAAINPRVRAQASDELEVRLDENEFEFDLTLENWHMSSLRISAESTDGKFADTSLVYGHDLRGAASHFHTLTLKPTQPFDFRVLNEGKPVPGAHVAVNTGDYFTAKGMTNKNGVATLNFPVNSTLDSVLAWCDDGQIGGYSFDRDPVRDPRLPLHEIEVSWCVDQKIRLVDIETGKPLVGFKFESEIATKPGYNFLPRSLADGMHDLVTDENGEAIDTWFPDWTNVHFYPQLDRKFEYGQGWSKAGDGKAKLVDGVFVCEFEQPPSLKRLHFKGQVILPEGVKGGLQVKLTSYQHPQEGRYDPITCRTDIDGNFTANVIPGATYSIAVNDPVWASEAWVGILAGAGSENVPSPKLTIFKGEPIAVTVTAGPDRNPLANTTIAFSSKFHFEWIEEGRSRGGSDSLQWWAATDENGVARTTAAPGKFSTHIYNPDWRPSQEFELKKGEPAELVFHRTSPGKRTVRGQLTFASDTAGEPKTLAGSVVELRAVDGETKSEATVSTDEDGKFSVEMDGAHIGGFATTTDRKYTSTFFISGLDDKLHKATLVPMIKYQGKVVDGSDQPIEDQELQLKVILKGKEDHNSDNRFVRNQFNIDTLSAVTDSSGLFEFMVPADMPCRLYYRTAPATDLNDGLRLFGFKHFISGEDRPLEIVKIGKAATPKYTPKQTVVWKVKDCQLSNTRHLFVLEGKGDSVSDFLQKALNEDSKKGRDLYWYGVTRISSSELIGAEPQKFWETYQSQLPLENEVTFLVLGHEAEKIDALTVDANDSAAFSEVVKFVKANRIETVDAQKTLDDALALAKSTDRRVWLQFCQTRCGPCFRLSRWIDKHKEVLEKAYIFIKVDDMRDDNGADIWKRYVGERSIGIPFSVVLDEEGNVLEESLDSNKSNIGFPSTFEDGRSFKRIFDATAKGNLSKDEIDSLVKSID